MAAVGSPALLLIFTVASALADATDHHISAPAPAPAVDCSSLILIMADCLSFVSSENAAAKPEGTCCSGLKMVLSIDAECLCAGFKSSASLGVALNVTKALSLPTACKIHAPPIASCGLSVPPAEAPGDMPPQAAAGGDAESTESNSVAPAPGHRSSASSLFPVAVPSLLTALVVLFLCLPGFC